MALLMKEAYAAKVVERLIVKSEVQRKNPHM